MSTPSIEELKAAYIKAYDTLSDLSKKQTEADTAKERAWDAMNDARIELFAAQHPEIAAEVEAINKDSDAFHERVNKLRQTVADLGLKLPQHYLRTP